MDEKVGLHSQHDQTRSGLHQDPSQWGATNPQQLAQQFTGPRYGTLMYNQPGRDGDLHYDSVTPYQDVGDFNPHPMWNNRYPHPAENTSFTSEWQLPQHEAPNLDGGSQNWAPNQPLSDPFQYQYVGQPNQPEWGRSFPEHPPPMQPLPGYASAPLPYFHNTPNTGFSLGARYYAEHSADGSYEFYQPAQPVLQYDISESQFRRVSQQGPPPGSNVHVPQRYKEWRSQEHSAEQSELNRRFKFRLQAGGRKMTADAIGVAPQAAAMQHKEEYTSQTDDQSGKDALSSVEWDAQTSLHPPSPPSSPSFPFNGKNQTSLPLRLRTQPHVNPHPHTRVPRRLTVHRERCPP